eukprot:470738_1
MGCCGNQEEEPVVGEDLELGQDGSAVDEIETYEQSVEKMMGLSPGQGKIAMGVGAFILLLVGVMLFYFFVFKQKSGDAEERKQKYKAIGREAAAKARSYEALGSIPDYSAPAVYDSEDDSGEWYGFE